MTILKPHRTNMKLNEIYPTAEDEITIATIHPASEDSVHTVLNASVNDEDGRSNWVWLRLPNGDLILGVFPQGDTYFSCEEDAHYPD